MLNLKQSTGYFSCSKCEIKGESVKYGNGNHLIFRYSDQLVLRDRENYQNSLDSLTKGVLGKCILSDLKYYHPILCTKIDVMHSVFLGVVKNFLFYWFNSKVTNRYSLKNNLSNLSIKMNKIKPPNLISQAPRALEDFKIWRAHEFMNFILFFALPIFYE